MSYQGLAAVADVVAPMRQEFLKVALKNGARLLQRPEGVKVDEQHIRLRPDMMSDTSGRLEVGQEVRVDCVRSCPFGLLPVEEDAGSVFVNSPEEEARIICFATVPFSGKCQVELLCAAVVRLRRNGQFVLDRRLRESDNQFSDKLNREKFKVVFYPLDALVPA